MFYIAKYREKSSYQKLARKAEACIVQKHTQIVQIQCVQIMIHGVWVGRRYFYFTQKKTQKRNLQKSTSQNQLARQSVTCVKASLDIEQSQVCLNGDTLVIQNASTMGLGRVNVLAGKSLIILGNSNVKIHGINLLICMYAEIGRFSIVQTVGNTSATSGIQNLMQDYIRIKMQLCLRSSSVLQCM